MNSVVVHAPLRRAIAAVLLAGVLPWGGTALAQTKSITFAGFGGPLQESVLRDLFADSGKLNLKIRGETSGFWTGIKTHLMAKAPGWDLTEVGFARCEQAAQAGLIQPIDYSIIDRSKIPAALAQPNYLGVYTFSYGIAYQTRKWGASGPRSWADFFDVQKFPGRRAMLADGLYALEVALLADGVAAQDVYKTLRAPGGVDRAFARLEKIKPHVAVWWKSGGQAAQLMRDGEVDMALFPNGRAKVLVEDGAPVTFVWNQAFIDTECFMLPNNASNVPEVMRLLNTALDPKNQAAFAMSSGYGPANLKVYEQNLIDEKLKSWLPTAPQNLGQQIWADQKWYASPEAEAAMQRFVKFLQQ